MPDRIYLMPVVTDSPNFPAGTRVPKYEDFFRSRTPRVFWSMVDYGAEPACLVMAKEILDADHATVNADPMVTAIPQNLGNTVGGSLGAVQNALENHNIPSEWVTSGMTYQDVLKGVLWLFQFQQKVYGLMPGLTLFNPNDNITMATTLGSLPANVRNTLRTAAESFGIVVSGLTGQDTVRDFYRLVRQQLLNADPPVPIHAFGLTF